jgi:succinoglycan biosynthesis protein ExoA
MHIAKSDSPTPASGRFISIVVPCRNERKHIREFLTSLAHQESPGADWEVIIADGRSTDGTLDLLQEFCRENPRFRVVDNPGQIVSTGLNPAIRSARGDVIIRMDAHTEYAPDYIRQCVAVLEESGAQNVGGAPRAKGDTLRSRVLAAAFHSPFAVGGSRSHDPDYEGYVDSVHYGCWKKETLLRLNLFDETLVRNQDDELNFRLTRAGGTVWQSKRIVCWYNPRPTVAGLFRQHFQYGYWKVAVIRKHGKSASWRHLIPGTFVVANIVLPLGAAAAAVARNSSMLALFAGTWLAMLAVYFAASFTAAFFTARRRGWAVLPFLPLVFCVYHVAYGLGFVRGMSHFRRPAQPWTPPSGNPVCDGPSQ